MPFSLKTFSESLVREKQRVLLASLIAEELDVLIIDVPTSGQTDIIYKRIIRNSYKKGKPFCASELWRAA